MSTEINFVNSIIEGFFSHDKLVRTKSQEKFDELSKNLQELIYCLSQIFEQFKFFFFNFLWIFIVYILKLFILILILKLKKALRLNLLSFWKLINIYILWKTNFVFSLGLYTCILKVAIQWFKIKFWVWRKKFLLSIASLLIKKLLLHQLVFDKLINYKLIHFKFFISLEWLVS